MTKPEAGCTAVLRAFGAVAWDTPEPLVLYADSLATPPATRPWSWCA